MSGFGIWLPDLDAPVPTTSWRPSPQMSAVEQLFPSEREQPRVLTLAQEIDRLRALIRDLEQR